MLAPLLSEQVRLAYGGPAWHGPSLSENLSGLTAEEAAAHPVPGAHSIWEIVLHATAWTREASRRLGGGEPGLPPEGDWPAVGEVSDRGWERAREALRDAHVDLAEMVARFPEARWDTRLGKERDAPLGTGVSYGALVNGLIQHGAYHGGQIGLLRRALRAG